MVSWLGRLLVLTLPLLLRVATVELAGGVKAATMVHAKEALLLPGMPVMELDQIAFGCRPHGDTSPEFKDSRSINHGEVKFCVSREVLPESNATKAWLPVMLARG
jgi:hypothetical protein